MRTRSTPNIANDTNGRNLSVPNGLNDISENGESNAFLRTQGGAGSQYPTIGRAPTSPRPRAHTYADRSMQGGQGQEQYRRTTPSTPGQAMQSTWAQPGARHASGGGTYIPPPPPPSAPPNQSMQIPPPPPRLPNSVAQSHGPWPPPPPGQPNGYGMYNRAASQATYPPPVNREPKAYDPTAYADYMQLPPLPPDNQPLTSATYIPDGGSFGPGVGIPPLESSRMQSPPPRPHPSQHASYGFSGDSGHAQQDYASTWYQQQPQTQTQPFPTLQQNNIPPGTPHITNKDRHPTAGQGKRRVPVFTGQ